MPPDDATRLEEFRQQVDRLRTSRPTGARGGQASARAQRLQARLDRSVNRPEAVEARAVRRADQRGSIGTYDDGELIEPDPVTTAEEREADAVNGGDAAAKDGGVDKQVVSAEKRRKRALKKAKRDFANQLNERLGGDSSALVPKSERIVTRKDLAVDDGVIQLKSSARKRVAVRAFNERGVDVTKSDIVLTGGGAALSDLAERRLAAADLDQQIADFDVSTSDVKLTGDGATLTEAAEKELAADRLEETLTQPTEEFGLGEGEREERLREFTAPEIDLDAGDVTISGVGAERTVSLSDAGREDVETQIRRSTPSPSPSQPTEESAAISSDQREELVEQLEQELQSPTPTEEAGIGEGARERQLTETTAGVDVDLDAGDVAFTRTGEGIEARLTEQGQRTVQVQQLEVALDADLEQGEDFTVDDGNILLSPAATDEIERAAGEDASPVPTASAFATADNLLREELAVESVRADLEQQLEEDTGTDLSREDVVFRRKAGNITAGLSVSGQKAVAVENAPFTDLPVVGGAFAAGARADVDFDRFRARNRRLFNDVVPDFSDEFDEVVPNYSEEFNEVVPNLEDEFNRLTPDTDEILGLATAAAPLAVAEPTPLGEIGVAGLVGVAGLTAGGAALGAGLQDDAVPQATASAVFPDELQVDDEQFVDELEPAGGQFVDELAIQEPTFDAPELLIGDRRPGRGGNVMPPEIETPADPTQEVTEIGLPDLTAQQLIGQVEEPREISRRVERQRGVSVPEEFIPDREVFIGRTPGGFGRTRFSGGSQIMDRRSIDTEFGELVLPAELSRVVEETDLGGDVQDVRELQALDADLPPGEELVPTFAQEEDVLAPTLERTATLPQIDALLASGTLSLLETAQDDTLDVRSLERTAVGADTDVGARTDALIDQRSRVAQRTQLDQLTRLQQAERQRLGQAESVGTAAEVTAQEPGFGEPTLFETVFEPVAPPTPVPRLDFDLDDEDRRRRRFDFADYLKRFESDVATVEEVVNVDDEVLDPVGVVE